MFTIFILVSESNEIKSIYPISTSCSFLATNFYEEASANLEEAYNFALIPERCCLLNDVIYPLDYIDEFYWTPWKSVEYDSSFFLREFEKVEENLARICADIAPIIDTDDTFLDEEFSEPDDLLDITYFEELKFPALSDNCENGFLEVPFIHNSALLLKPEKSLAELLRNIPLVEVEDIFKRDVNLIDKSFDENMFLENELVTTDEFNEDFEKFENFKEIILPKVPDEDLNLNLLSVHYKKDDLILCLKNTKQPQVNTDNNSEEPKFSENLTQPCQSLYVLSSNDKNFSDYKYSNNYCSYSSNESGDRSTVTCKRNMSQMQFNGKYSALNFSCEVDTPEIKEFNSDNSIFSDEDDHMLNSKCDKETDDYFSEICNDDFFSEPFMDSNDSDDYAEAQFQSACEQNSAIKNSCEKISSFMQSSDKKLFLDKLSKLDFINESLNSNFIQMDIRTDSENVLKSSTVFRRKNTELNNDQENETVSKQNVEYQHSSENEMKVDTYHNEDKNKGISKQNMEHQHLFENEIKTDVCQRQGSFDLLSQIFEASMKESELLLSFASRFSNSQTSQNSFDENNDNYIDSKGLKGLNNDADSCYEEKRILLNSVENKLQLPEEDISVKLPDDYVKLVLTYESSTVFYIQKLALWENFKLSPNLTIVDISLDKTRFLLNQEVKNCRDRNINPLEGGSVFIYILKYNDIKPFVGFCELWINYLHSFKNQGVRYGHYIQLLVLHGILKSLNCLIHFGPELAISSLYEYEIKHTGLLKGCFQNLIEEVSIFIGNLPKPDSIHPKIKEMSIYLQKKYYFCKENMIPFKVLIILKDYLNFFYAAFEAYMKTLLPEIIIDLIPESDCLEQETNYFRSEELICIVSVLSIVKSTPWKSLTLVIEYQTDKNVCWKSVCKREKVSHIHIKFDSLPLKTLDEFKHLPLLKDPPCKRTTEVKGLFLVVSASISSEYSIRNLCNLEPNVSFVERDYKKHLPHMDFADIDIDYRTSIMIIRLTEFLSEGSIKNLTKKIFNMHLKYDICWIVIHDDLTYKDLGKDVSCKIQEAFIKFYFTVVTMKFDQSFKIKFLYGQSKENIKKCISSVLSKNFKILLSKSDEFPVNSFTADMTIEELFLMSFPSFNPFIASFLLSHKIPLFQLMNFTLEDLYKTFNPIPERFLKHFYSLIHETINLSSSSKDFQENVYGNFMKSDPISRNSDPNFLFKKLNSNTDELVDFITCLEKDHSFEDRLMTDFIVKTPKSKSGNSETPVTNDYSEMSVEEIDRNYRALKLQDMTYASFDVEFENNFDFRNTQSYVQSLTSAQHLVSPDGYSSKVIDPVLKKRKHESIIFQNDSDNMYMKENHIHSSTESKDSKSFYENDIYHTQLSQYDNKLLAQNDLNNIIVKENQAHYSSKSENLIDQNLNYPSKNYLHYQSDPSDDIKHSLKFSRNECENLQNIQVEKIRLSQCDNLLVSQNNFKNIYLKTSQKKYSGDADANSQNVPVKQLNLSQYRFKKRKNIDFEILSQSKLPKYSSQDLQNSSPRLQKGQSSKTVCKQVSFKSSPIVYDDENDFYSYDVLHSSTSSQVHVPSYVSNDISMKSDSICTESIDSLWMSQSTVTLTPRTSRKLAYEKIPGMKGQTRLTFY